jgi:hypothetical protein
MRVGQARKRDSNEPDIVKGMRKFGALVWQLSGPGVPDLLAHFGGRWYVLDVKSPKGKETPKQKESWQGRVPIVETLDEAIEVLCNRRTATANRQRGMNGEARKETVERQVENLAELGRRIARRRRS